ncbi:endonuclease/exonuclease/phosphatase family protein [Sphingobacterium sp. SGR-19]|uniref:endonuclease/exonuclease/phosphatase family protein n=1 Tax=Sphingobacterium sp. SGR-19 TaxID=2710886 RepID=UPI0013EA61AE|nr:endonuclease/exonuclease/phosphatase family protein [Sphingobacterium sp. SGR-19]NGM64093.1 endonuclease/exonuclease/phosphatase family protein [Sphingobacterium sp. SGR-19]
MSTTLTVISLLLIFLSVVPFIQHQHWFFRVAEFIKIQLVILQVLVFGIMMVYVTDNVWLWTIQILQFVLIVYHIYILMRYTKFWRKQKPTKTSFSSDKIKIISCNIYQFNNEYHRFIELIEQEQPDIFVTMESNADWENSLRILEKDYPYQEKVTLENTYGMHFYTRLKVKKIQTHYFVADDIPSIEAELETGDGHRFVFFAVHPPPPSPTEEENSKERDGDLLSVAKRVRKLQLPVVVTGDFNNVAWARSSILFKKASELIDARIGRGILSTFHAKYWFFRVPLDLLFHSTTIIIDKLFIYPSVGSDHFPIGCTFHVDVESDDQEEEVKHLENGEMQEVNEFIADGKAEESENR